jgi:hypothetical protein
MAPTPAHQGILRNLPMLQLALLVFLGARCVLGMALPLPGHNVHDRSRTVAIPLCHTRARCVLASTVARCLQAWSCARSSWGTRDANRTTPTSPVGGEARWTAMPPYACSARWSYC